MIMNTEKLLQSLVGMPEAAVEEAVRLVVGIAPLVRVTRRDNESFMGDMMFEESRINVEVDNGIVSKAYLG